MDSDGNHNNNGANNGSGGNSNSSNAPTDSRRSPRTSTGSTSTVSHNNNHHDPDPKNLKGKMWSRTTQILFFICGWYLCSGVTLFGNKHMLSTLKAHPDLLALSQMVITATMGASKMYGSFVLSGCRDRSKLPSTPYSRLPRQEFMCDMAVVGIMRVVTVILGLVSLKYVAVSFTETVKSSAPFFTVVIARLMLGERTSFMVSVSGTRTAVLLYVTSVQ